MRQVYPWHDQLMVVLERVMTAGGKRAVVVALAETGGGGGPAEQFVDRLINRAGGAVCEAAHISVDSLTVRLNPAHRLVVAFDDADLLDATELTARAEAAQRPILIIGHGYDTAPSAAMVAELDGWAVEAFMVDAIGRLIDETVVKDSHRWWLSRVGPVDRVANAADAGWREQIAGHPLVLVEDADGAVWLAAGDRDELCSGLLIDPGENAARDLRLSTYFENSEVVRVIPVEPVPT